MFFCNRKLPEKLLPATIILLEGLLILYNLSRINDIQNVPEES